MRIGQLSEATGVDVETIRYYEKIGLLAKPERGDNGYRQYDDASLQKLAFIRHCRALDIPLADIKQLLAFAEHPELDCGGVDRLIALQLARVQARLKSLAVLERQLIALHGQCNVGSTVENCGILNELVAAARHEDCVCHVSVRDKLGDN